MRDTIFNGYHINYIIIFFFLILKVDVLLLLIIILFDSREGGN